MGWRYTQGAPDLSGVAEQIAAVQNQTSKNASDIAALQAINNAATANGKSYSVKFLTDTDRTANFNSNPNGVAVEADGGLAVTYGAIPAGTTLDTHVIFQQPLATLEQSIVAVLETDNNATGFMLFIGATGNLSTALCAYIQYASQSVISFFTVSYNPATQAYSYGSTLSVKQGNIPATLAGSTVELKRTALGADEFYSVIINGTTAHVWTDVGGTVNHGATNVYTGWIGRDVGVVGPSRWSPTITSLTTSDLAIPVIKGTGWYMYRNTTATVSMGSGDQMCAANTFNTTLQNSNMLAVTNTGSVTVQIAGWYTVDLCITFNGNGAYAPQLWTNLNTDGSVNSSNTMRMTRKGQNTGGADISKSWVIYCPTGTIIRAGARTPFATNIVGEVTGSQTYFSGTLTSIGG